MSEFGLGKGVIMRYAIIENGIVKNIAIASPELAASKGWRSITDDVAIGWWYEDGEFSPAPEAPVEIELDVLSTDTWTILADGSNYATVTYTDQETVYFSINETVHAIEPIDYVATLEITADAPGPIRVEVKSKQLIITAIEVQA